MDQNRFKMRISRMFRSSFGSCRTRNLSDVIEKAVFIPQSIPSPTQSQRFQTMMETLPSKARPFPSICRPNCPKTTTQVISSSIVSRPKLSGLYPSVFKPGNKKGHACPPVSPMAPFNPFYEGYSLKEARKFSIRRKERKTNKKKKNRNKNNKSSYMRSDRNLLSSSSHDSKYFENSYWFSSEDDADPREDESDAFFSSRSLSSDSSISHRCRSSRKQNSSSRRRRAASSKSSSGKMAAVPLDGKVKGSFAVVKRSSDPYNDFRTSMLEMIVEKQIFASKDLEHLLQCFLSLNSYHHHKIIVEVFTDIWEALFSNFS
ncbi:hypothetical protein K2173_013225 [Erythroxylum novogranatense]|uniref:Transcription repressor n=1 Tax=Erythroxylum novogranatense TaxID=1862640 RepID=A0AAV8SCF0_9ROSI|nr:hypothetical protein K2173_013225 [Erythroxylum novogranatense]